MCVCMYIRMCIRRETGAIIQRAAVTVMVVFTKGKSRVISGFRMCSLGGEFPCNLISYFFRDFEEIIS